METLAENWTLRDLNIYINRISSEKKRKFVLGQILDKKRLREYLDTPDGELIFRDAVNILYVELSEICELALDDPRANIDKIVKSSDKYRAAMDIMCRWAGLIQIGEAHEKEIKAIAAKNK